MFQDCGMTAAQFRAALEALDLSHARAGKVLGADRRTVLRWATGERAVPPQVQKLIRLMRAGRLTADEVEAA
jgi:transcriptional regulator with XRE-family HTH domain